MTFNSDLTRSELIACVELGKALTSELDGSHLLEKILQKIKDLLPALNWSLLLIDETTNELRFELSIDLDINMVKDIRISLEEGIAGQVASSQKAMVVEDVEKSPYFSNRVDRLSKYKTKSIICVPLIYGGRSLGVIEVVNPAQVDDKTVSLLSIIADYAAIAVENMRRYRKIHHLAIHDDLTGLYNQRYLYNTLNQLISNFHYNSAPISLIFMDVDNFKKIVDTYGHLKGSRTLQELAHRIDDMIDDPGFGVAYGGDEFVVVLPGFEKKDAIEKAQAIRSSISQASYLSAYGHNLTLQASLGVATFPDDAKDVSGLMALADHAMFDVKAAGKNGVRSITELTTGDVA